MPASGATSGAAEPTTAAAEGGDGGREGRLTQDTQTEAKGRVRPEGREGRWGGQDS